MLQGTLGHESCLVMSHVSGICCIGKSETDTQKGISFIQYLSLIAVQTTLSDCCQKASKVIQAVSALNFCFVQVSTAE